MEISNKNDVWKVHILSTSWSWWWWWWRWRLRLRLRLLYIIAVTVLVLEITLKRAKPLPGDQISRKMAEKCRHLWTQQTGGFLLQGQLNSQKAVSEHLYKIRDPTELTRFRQKGPRSYFFRWNIIPIWFLPQPSYCEGHRRQAFPRRCFHLQQVHQVRRAVGVRHHQDLRGFPVGFWDQTLVPCPIYEDPLMGWVASGIWYSTYIYTSLCRYHCVRVTIWLSVYLKYNIYIYIL